MNLSIQGVTVSDSTGTYSFDPNSAAHAYGYNPDGTLATDTATWGGLTFVKSFTYTAGQLTGESAWVKQ